MKNIKLIFLLSLIYCSACQKNEDTTMTSDLPPTSTAISVTDMNFISNINESNSIFTRNNGLLRMHNVTVQLIYEGEVLDETNTNQKGVYELPTQPVPDEGAYLLFTSPGYYPQVIKIDSLHSNGFTRYMVRETFEYASGEALSTADEYINLRGHLQNPTTGSGASYFITNANNELVGAYASDGGLGFEITTVPNETLYFHYQFRCQPPSAPIELGPFTEDTDVGSILDQTLDLLQPYALGELTTDDCAGGSTSGFILKQFGEHTYFERGHTNFNNSECYFELFPDATFTVVNASPRKYGEQALNYVAGQPLELSVSTCSIDDTFLKYTIGGGAEIDPDIYAFANILPNGKTVLKQFDYDWTTNGVYRVFELMNSTIGNTNAIVRYFHSSDIILGGESLAFDITFNDGEYIEGTFSGEVFDPFEDSLGDLEGSFRARIH